MARKRAASVTKRPKAEPGDLRAHILRASVELIEEEGLQKLSMREVARRAGVTHQAPYHYFKDREAILAEICEEGFGELTKRIDQAQLAGGPHVSAVQRLSAAGKAYVQFACDRPAHFRIMFRPELVDHERFPNAQAAGDCAFESVMRSVHAMVEYGVPAVPSEASLMALCWSVSHGLACLILDGPLAKKQSDRTVAQQIDDVVLTMQNLLEASVEQAKATKKRTRKA